MRDEQACLVLDGLRIHMLNSGWQSSCGFDIHISKSVRFFSAVQLLLACVCRVDCRRCRTQTGGTCLVTDAGDGEGGFLGSAKQPRFRGKRRNAHD